MIGRHILALAAALSLLGPQIGVATAETPSPLDAPAADQTSQSAPASISVTVRFSSFQDISASDGDENSFVLPVYFAAGETVPGSEARLALAALADEAAAHNAVAITVSSAGSERDRAAGLQDARAVSVFNMLSELGVPVRVMALDLGQGPGASLPSGTFAALAI